MSWELTPFPDAEQVLLDLLEQVTVAGEPVATVTETKNPLEPPVIRVQRVGGPSDRFNDRPRLEVSCYGINRPQSRAMESQVRVLIPAHSGKAVNGVLIDKAREDTGPARVPYEAEDVRRVVSHWVLTFRRVKSVA